METMEISSNDPMKNTTKKGGLRTMPFVIGE